MIVFIIALVLAFLVYQRNQFSEQKAIYAIGTFVAAYLLIPPVLNSMGVSLATAVASTSPQTTN